MDYRETLLTVAHAYCVATDLSLARVSTLVRNDGKFFKRMAESGAGCTMATYEAAMRWFVQHWPTDKEWPMGIDRPSTPPPDPDLDRSPPVAGVDTAGTDKRDAA